jgi:tRNA A-37 threonylcarbamoyl transferase component Bud32
MRHSQSAHSKVSVRPVEDPGVHPAGIVYMTDGIMQASLFAKVEKPDYSGRQSLQRELHFLSNIAPLITAENPRLRSPLPIAYYPEQRLLLMEFIPGYSLKHCIFDINFNRPSQPGLAELLQHAGRWLGSFHRLTVKGTHGNPLEWLLQEFNNVRTLEAFVFYSLKDVYDEMLVSLKKLLDLKPTFQRNLCNVHGEFTPIHIMVADNAIYVVDFGNSRVGYVYEDVGLFESFYDCLLPWRSFIGSSHLTLHTQKELFLRGYFEQWLTPFSAADRAIMRWVRLISIARMLHGGQSRYSGWGRWIYSRLALCTLRDKFTRLCHNELTAIRAIQADIFNEISYIEQQQQLTTIPSKDPDDYCTFGKLVRDQL